MLAASSIVSCVHAGHYAGATAAGEPVSFDVTGEGEVTNVTATVSGAVISISHRFPVDGDGGWGGEVVGKGVRMRIRGWLGAAEAEGTLEADLVNGWAHHLAGPISWRARKVVGLAY